MRKFLIKFLYFFVPVLFMGIFLEVLLRNIPNEYSLKKEFLDKNSNKLDVLILGSSHTYMGINPGRFSQKAYNAAMFSQSLDYDLKIIEKYKNELVNLNTLIIPISYPTLFSNLEAGVEKWRIKNYNIYYGFSNQSVWQYSTEILSTSFKINLLRLKDHYILKTEALKMDSLGWEGKNYRATQLELKESGVEAASRHTTDNQKALDNNITTLKKIIDIAAHKKWNILLVTPPAYYTYRDNLSEKQISLTFEFCEKLSLTNPHVKYLNLLDSSIFNEIDFYDADHLNSEGAKKFSLLVDQFLSK